MPSYRFSVLETLPNGGLIHVCSYDSLIAAQQSVLNLTISQSHTEFLIYDAEEHRFVSRISKSAQA